MLAACAQIPAKLNVLRPHVQLLIDQALDGSKLAAVQRDFEREAEPLLARWAAGERDKNSGEIRL
eukprot:SAG31_NODE_3372_length_4351_cov_4.835842_5_plen_65_part_00